MLRDPTTKALTTDDSAKLRILRDQRARLAEAQPGGRRGAYAADADHQRDYP